MDNRYNGWRNRETWLVNLWFDGTFNASDTAHSIRETVTEHVDSQIGTNGFIVDMIDMDCIDWDELAEHYADVDADT